MSPDPSLLAGEADGEPAGACAEGRDGQDHIDGPERYRSGDADDRDMLAVGACDTVDHTQRPRGSQKEIKGCPLLWRRAFLGLQQPTPSVLRLQTPAGSDPSPARGRSR
jgi:hypothetical protein